MPEEPARNPRPRVSSDESEGRPTTRARLEVHDLMGITAKSRQRARPRSHSWILTCWGVITVALARQVVTMPALSNTCDSVRRIRAVSPHTDRGDAHGTEVLDREVGQGGHVHLVGGIGKGKGGGRVRGQRPVLVT